ncbi:MAG: hemerythrin family protein [Rhodospirillaceae bacterium]|nr:hemerythrin family protein [Rhodospirillaceae bacterium]
MKNQISWDDRLAIDGDAIDADHKHIIEIINRFLGKVGNFQSAKELVEILETLHEAAHDHFRREEELQRIIKYPDRDIHFTEHQRLTTKLEKLIEESRPTGGSYVNVMGDKVSDFVHEWLFSHILKSDMKMKPYVKHARKKLVSKPAGQAKNDNPDDSKNTSDNLLGNKRIVSA